jgi:hypothetical protein
VWRFGLFSVSVWVIYKNTISSVSSNSSSHAVNSKLVFVGCASLVYSRVAYRDAFIKNSFVLIGFYTLADLSRELL